MSDELRKMVIDILKDGSYFHTEEQVINKGIDKINQWHKSERKKWALGKLPEETELFKTNPLSSDIIYQSNREAEIYNQCLAEIRKKIEEG
ncbi:MAG: hypothetical protein E3J63_01000 [Elusimicrobia bacterium]|nr:MAG: hypothetical protein E3J63_01000 [Elusimicrobiota bacterium]